MSLQYNEGHPITKTCSKPSVLSYFFPFFPQHDQTRPKGDLSRPNFISIPDQCIGIQAHDGFGKDMVCIDNQSHDHVVEALRIHKGVVLMGLVALEMVHTETKLPYGWVGNAELCAFPGQHQSKSCSS